MKILVTGGAGFIGSFLTDRLIKEGNSVRIYDNLEPQVHPGNVPLYLNKNAEFIKGDICDLEKLDKALVGMDVVFHEAAMVGVGQSMYEIAKYTRVNSLGTATLLDLIVNKHRDHIRKMMIAGSMSEYGEGLYECQKCGKVKPGERSEKDLTAGIWETKCPNCSDILIPLPTSEEVTRNCTSVYALNKMDQEEMFMTVGKAFRIPTVVLRYFNVYGPRQSLSNPYTGVAAIFMSRIKAGKAPVIYEDGLQSRDFVSVHDIVSANLEVMKNEKADFHIFNVGSGKKITILEIAQTLIHIFGAKVKPEVLGKFRKGDIRHCFSDIGKISKTLGWKPEVEMENGMKELINWSYDAPAEDNFDRANEILKSKGLL